MAVGVGAEGGDESGGALRMNLMGWNKETLYTDYAVLGGQQAHVWAHRQREGGREGGSQGR